MSLLGLTLAVVSTFIVLSFIIFLLRRRLRKRTIGIFHLYCASGGGGERVLWHTVQVLLSKYPKYTIHIYTHKLADDDTLKILVQARDLFKIDLISDEQIINRLEFIPLRMSHLVEAKRYTFMTLFFQNFASVLLAIQAAYKLTPEVYMETIGFACTLPVFKILGSSTVTYVHYPTISTDMIENVSTSSHASFNNREVFVRNSYLRDLKLIYYKILVYLYRIAGSQADLVFVNSSWTKKHITSLWNKEVYVIYPPCDTESFNDIYRKRLLDDAGKEDKNSLCQPMRMVSIAQFRPEKNHHLQIEAFDWLVKDTYLSQPEPIPETSRLVMYGGCRNAEDYKRVEYLNDLIQRLDLNSSVDIVVNAPFETILKGMYNSDVALHTMTNEHFGIVLVEFMAAGLITVAHDSGGPKCDIITDGVDGFLAKDKIDFGCKLRRIWNMGHKERQKIKANAVARSKRFSVQNFEEKLGKYMELILPTSD